MKRSTQLVRIVLITGHRWQRVSSLRTGELYGTSIQPRFLPTPRTNPRPAHGTEVHSSPSFRSNSLTMAIRSVFQRLYRRYRRRSSTGGHTLLQNHYFRRENSRHRRRRTCFEGEYVAPAQDPLQSRRWVNIGRRRCRHRRRWKWDFPLHCQFTRGV